jgi:antitoxin component YwqK of YwqJK toxin-antitoxin module
MSLHNLVVENPEILSGYVIPHLNDALSFCRFSLLCKATWAFVRSHIVTHPRAVEKVDNEWYVLEQRHGKYSISYGFRHIRSTYINDHIEGKYRETRYGRCTTTIFTYCKNGSYHGPFIKKINGEHIIKQCTYYAGYKHGLCFHYDTSGALRRVSNYVDGFLVGKLKKYCDHVLSAVVKYHGGEKYGNVRKFYTLAGAKGCLRVKGQCCNNKKVGEWLRYGESGKIQYMDTYENNRRISREKVKN